MTPEGSPPLAQDTFPTEIRPLQAGRFRTPCVIQKRRFRNHAQHIVAPSEPPRGKVHHQPPYSFAFVPRVEQHALGSGRRQDRVPHLIRRQSKALADVLLGRPDCDVCAGSRLAVGDASLQ